MIAIIGLAVSIVMISTGEARTRAKITSSLQFSQIINNRLGADAVGIWDFNEGSAFIATCDRSGWGNHCVINGAGWTDETPHKVIAKGDGKYALEFYGAEDVNCGSAASLNLGQGTPFKSFTIEAWIKTSNARSGGVVSWGENAAGKRRSIIVWQSRFWFSGRGAASSLDSKVVVNDNKWHHLMATCDSSKYVKVYVDGEYKNGSGILTLKDFNFSGTLIGSTQNFEHFNGIIDEVKIYHQSLTSSQIQKRYAEGAARHDIALTY